MLARATHSAQVLSAACSVWLARARTDCIFAHVSSAELGRLSIEPLGMNCEGDGTSVVILNSKLAGKAPTLSWVCSQLGLATDGVWAFGDGNNDAAMLQAAGWGCACANAEPTAKELASAVSMHTNNDLNFIAAELDIALGWWAPSKC